MRKYRCLKQNRYDFEEFSLIPVREEDIQIIRKWRNEQVKILRQSHIITKEEQENYFEKNIWNQFNLENPKQLLFSYFRGENLIGYGGLVHFNWLDNRAEISFLLDTQFIKNTKIHDFLFEKYLILIQKVGFEDLKLNRLHAEIFDNRPHHIEILEKQGFIFEGRLRNHIYVEGKYIDSLIHGKLKTEF